MLARRISLLELIRTSFRITQRRLLGWTLLSRRLALGVKSIRFKYGTRLVRSDIRILLEGTWVSLG